MVVVDNSPWMNYGPAAEARSENFKLTMQWQLGKDIEDTADFVDSGSFDERAKAFAKVVASEVSQNSSRQQLARVALEMLLELERRNQDMPYPRDVTLLNSAMVRLSAQALGLRKDELDLPTNDAPLNMLDISVVKNLVVQPGERFSFELPEISSTGYLWRLSIEGDGVSLVDKLQLDSKNKLGRNKERLIGNETSVAYTLQALHEGEAKLKFTLDRPWDPSDIARTHEVSVIIRKTNAC